MFSYFKKVLSGQTSSPPRECLILLRRDIAENWKTHNPVLADCELAIDRTNRKLKMGDGKTAWNDLPYVEGISISKMYFEGHILKIEKET